MTGAGVDWWASDDYRKAVEELRDAGEPPRWYRNPRLAYAKGLRDGMAAERERIANVQPFSADEHLTGLAQRRRRRAADAPRRRRSDWPGTDNMTTEQRREVWRALLASWGDGPNDPQW